MKLSYLVIILIFMLLFSCTPIIYKPNTINIPLLSEKGEVDIALNTGNHDIELQTSYAFSQRFAFMCNGYYTFDEDHNLYQKYEHKYAEIGIGNYNKINIFLGEDFFLEEFIGIGRGKSFACDKAFILFSSQTYIDSISGNFNRLFVQLNLGKTLKIFDDYFLDFGWAFRCCYLNFTSLEHNFGHAVRRDNIFYEFAGFIKFGWEKVKFQFQIGVSEPYWENNNFTHDRVWGSIGLNFKL